MSTLADLTTALGSLSTQATGVETQAALLPAAATAAVTPVDTSGEISTVGTISSALTAASASIASALSTLTPAPATPPGNTTVETPPAS